MEGVPFEDYIKLPGHSYSMVKATGSTANRDVTSKMKFGSLVDAFIFEPQHYTGEQYELVRPVAERITRDLGPLIRNGKRQLAVMCTMVYNHFYMFYKGRLDLYAGDIVIDLKISEMRIFDAINHFGYNHQVNGYCIPLRSRCGLIYSVGPKKPYPIQVASVPNSLTFWQQAVLKYGKPC